MKLAGLVFGLCVVGAAWADGASKPVSSAKQAKIEQQLAQRNAEIEQLRQDVKVQEAKSRETDQRLQQQDRTMADLRKQLSALNAAPDAGQGRH
ncbi:hypothetical protein DVJ77_02215 [Dyella tabacisoli]|uniref:Tol-pal system protein YbgF n=2 Tax=Dyella tabacisoli TaxID=2282381 RepID=A0A369UUL6_9GAMM|nr:hypothetical protein DVJ77_02215 [Dyella tabacisoli]